MDYFEKNGSGFSPSVDKIPFMKRELLLFNTHLTSTFNSMDINEEKVEGWGKETNRCRQVEMWKMDR